MTGNKRRAGVRPQRRDWSVAEHLFFTRALNTYQLAHLEFGSGFHAAQSRLYLLKRAGFLTNSTGHGEAGTVWQLSMSTFAALRGDDRTVKHPGPLGHFGVRHLIATNEVYVRIFPSLRGVGGLRRDDWRWIREPICHRRYSLGLQDGARHVLKPDAAVAIFEKVFFLERQTARARERPEKLRDKTLAYHRFANSTERRRDPREMALLWACDEERDAKAALSARSLPPSEGPRGTDYDAFPERRMAVQAGTVEAVAGFLLGQARELTGQVPETAPQS